MFITGYSNEYLDMIAVTSAEGVDRERIFTQTNTTTVHNDTVLSGFAGQHEIKISGDLTVSVNSSMFVGFDEEQSTIGQRRAYGGYGMFLT